MGDGTREYDEADRSEGTMNVLYKPWGAITGMVGGAIAAAAFKRIWQLFSDDNDAPDALDRSRSWLQIVAVAALEGAIYGGIKALVERGGAKGFAKATGSWPA